MKKIFTLIMVAGMLSLTATAQTVKTNSVTPTHVKALGTHTFTPTTKKVVKPAVKATAPKADTAKKAVKK